MLKKTTKHLILHGWSPFRKMNTGLSEYEMIVVRSTQNVSLFVIVNWVLCCLTTQFQLQKLDGDVVVDDQYIRNTSWTIQGSSYSSPMCTWEAVKWGAWGHFSRATDNVTQIRTKYKTTVLPCQVFQWSDKSGLLTDSHSWFSLSCSLWMARKQNRENIASTLNTEADIAIETVTWR
jgi:hypothetical protein